MAAASTFGFPEYGDHPLKRLKQGCYSEKSANLTLSNYNGRGNRAPTMIERACGSGVDDLELFGRVLLV